jgi:hypothetical protein
MTEGALSWVVDDEGVLREYTAAATAATWTAGSVLGNRDGLGRLYVFNVRNADDAFRFVAQQDSDDHLAWNVRLFGVFNGTDEPLRQASLVPRLPHSQFRFVNMTYASPALDETTTFTLQELDLSSLIPSNAVAVRLRVSPNAVNTTSLTSVIVYPLDAVAGSPSYRISEVLSNATSEYTWTFDTPVSFDQRIEWEASNCDRVKFWVIGYWTD